MRSALVFVIAALALALPGAGNAAPPSNDAFASATAISSLPFSETVNLSEATLESGEPGGGCWPIGGSAWYKLEPTQTTTLQITSSAGFDRTVSVYRQFGSDFGGLSFVACGYQGNATPQLQGGATYYVQIARASWSGGGPLDLTLAVLPPPSNDAFADAHVLGSLGSSEIVNMIASTVEPGEPAPSGISSFQGTAWWSFVAPESGSMLINELGCCGYSNGVGVYTGSTLGSLSEVTAYRAYGRTVFEAMAGQEYRIQLGHHGLYGGDGRLGVSIDRAPAPSASFSVYPGDPSSFDTISLYGYGYDPAAMPIDSYAWDFGDGGSASGQSATHRYFADGTYPVTITVETIDGRTASYTGNVIVKTHDVAITRLSVPQSATAGQSRQLSVALKNTRYAESVTVTFYRSHVGGGWDQVGSQTQAVPTTSGNRTTTFGALYTFTADDKAVGKVTFKAVATINSARDALPADNEVVAFPTKVS